ncbi:hypothetical protein G8770_19700 [Aestuariicella hydrocarbonica]|uniref:Uncharacterized protein n=1 Tax=Pseudomaricurvus hydrocarbonicus TaxID=1470433 RepID=A0A9E5MP56_9GAMM|nr:hypothetical protein [Aestuariicella hydrocarbonica]NHO67777.1 hypothetical protein [Aestuariicella hydrocarbonica]
MPLKVLTILLFSISLFGCNAGNIKPKTPGVGSVKVIPDEKVYLTVDIQSGNVLSVSRGESSGNITFELSKMSSGMMLSASNTLDQIVKYDIYMIDYNGNKHYTSSCPMMAGAGVFESWPHNIPQLSIENFRVLAASDELACQ